MQDWHKFNVARGSPEWCRVNSISTTAWRQLVDHYNGDADRANRWLDAHNLAHDLEAGFWRRVGK